MRKEEERFADSTLMEGMVSFRAVMKAIEEGFSDRRVEKVLIDSSKKEKSARHISYIKAMSSKYGFPIEYVSEEEIGSLAIGNSHGGILAFCSERTVLPLSSLKPTEKGFYVLLNGIEDPYNFGYALRSVYASGADGVILSKRNWMSAAGVVARASAGASELIPIYTSESDEEIASFFRNAGYKIVSAQLENSVSLYDSDLSRPLLLAVGGERRGLTKAIIDASSAIVRIDYGRDTGTALSAASAAAILSFEVYRQNRK